jgi:hypothetical protein
VSAASHVQIAYGIIQAHAQQAVLTPSLPCCRIIAVMQPQLVQCRGIAGCTNMPATHPLQVREEPTQRVAHVQQQEPCYRRRRSRRRKPTVADHGSCMLTCTAQQLHTLCSWCQTTQHIRNIRREHVSHKHISTQPSSRPSMHQHTWHSLALNGCSKPPAKLLCTEHHHSSAHKPRHQQRSTPDNCPNEHYLTTPHPHNPSELLFPR